MTVVMTICAVATLPACRRKADGPPTATGYVEATEVRVAPQVGGRVLDLAVQEGDRVTAGQRLARLDTADAELAVQRAAAERDQAVAQLRLLEAGARVEDIRQAQAQAQSADADVAAAESELASAQADFERFDALLRQNSGARKQRDDAATRVDVARARLGAARQRAQAAAEGTARLKAGARPEEIAAARARVAAAEAQLATLQKRVTDATLDSPVAGIVTSKLVDAGETVAAGTPLVVVTDLDHAWANVYVDAPMVPQLRIGQTLTLMTDDGQDVPATITFVSPKAEFTPRNVQTAEERSRLVYRIKATADNRQGVLKVGMPVTATF